MLKASGALLLLVAAAVAPARADSLLTGILRDRAGVAVAGARVTAYDRSGRSVGDDVAAADGTFAINTAGSAATITIACDFCRTERRAVGTASEPIVVIVTRFAAVASDVPSAADINALPYRSAADVASLRPFTVVRSGRVSDRGLDVYGATLVDGLAFYSPLDGDNYSRLVPAHGVAAFSATSPLVAPIYGGYASAGIYDMRLRDGDAPPGRSDGGNGFDLAARLNGTRASGYFGTSNDDGLLRTAAAAEFDVPVGGGRLSLNALDMGDSGAHASGAGLAYLTDSRRYSTAVSLQATQTGDASLVTAGARIRNRGPLALEFGVRSARATSGLLGNASAQSDAAIYADALRTSGVATFAADVALDRGSDTGYGGNSRAQAVVGSLGTDVRLSANWSAHTGVVSNLRIPTFAETSAYEPEAVPGDRSLMFEEALTYADLRRLRVSGVAYTQRTTTASTAHVNGLGIKAAWQLAPLFSLRTWLLRANLALQPVLVDGPAPYMVSGSASALTRQLVWLTYENGVRIDALVRGGALEADIRVPLPGNFALAVGTASYNGKRVTTLGVTVR